MQLGGTSVHDASRRDDENEKRNQENRCQSQKLTEQDEDKGRKKWRTKSRGRYSLELQMDVPNTGYALIHLYSQTTATFMN